MKEESQGDGKLPLGDALAGLLRWSWVIVLCTATAVAGVYSVLRAEPPLPTASVLIGLTEEVQWPHFDAVRERALSRLDGELVDATARSLDTGGTIVDVDSDVPPSQAYVRVTVTATNEATALAAAEGLAQRVVEVEHEASIQAEQASLISMSAEIDETERRLAEMEAELDAAIAAEAAAYDVVDQSESGQRAPAQAAALQARVQRELLDNALKSAARNLESLRFDRDRLQRDLADRRGTVEVIRPGVLEQQATTERRAPLLLAALSGLVLGALMARFLDHHFGKARSAESIKATTGLPVLDVRRSPDGWQRVSLALADATDEGANVIGLAGPDVAVAEAIASAVDAVRSAGDHATAAAPELLLSVLSTEHREWAMIGVLAPPASDLGIWAGRSCLAAATGEAAHRADVVLVELGEPIDEHFALGSGLVDAACIVVPTGISYRRLRFLVRAVADAGLLAHFVVLAPGFARPEVEQAVRRLQPVTAS